MPLQQVQQQEENKPIIEKTIDQSTLDQSVENKALIQKQEEPIEQISIKEQKWKEAKKQPSPLKRSAGTKILSTGYKLSWYSSTKLYHWRTPQFRLDDNHWYRDWNGYEWCYVVSMNSSYKYGTNGKTVNVGIITLMK